MKTATQLVLLACAASLVACASQPSAAPASVASGQVAAPVAAVTPALVVPGAPAAATSPASAGSAAPATATTAAQTEAAQKVAGQAGGTQTVEIYGYRRTVINNEERFCKTEEYTGSRVHKEELCYTRAQLEAKQKDAENYIRQIQQNSGTAIRANTPGGGGAMGH